MEADYALELDSINVSSLDEDKFVVRLHGRWQGRLRPAVDGAMLMVEADGERHRFPAVPHARRARILRPGTWAANFELPIWLLSRLEGNTSFNLGEFNIPLPPGSFRTGEQADPGPDPHVDPHPDHDADPHVDPHPDHDADPHVDPHPDPETDRPPDSGGGGDPALVQTVAALRAELELRATGEAGVRGQLTEALADLEAQAANQALVEATHAELGRELDGLREAIEQLDGELVRLRAALASSEVARDASLSEAAGLRAELERIGAELAAARRHGPAGSNDVHEAEALLAEARALRAKLSEHAASDAAPAGPE